MIAIVACPPPLHRPRMEIEMNAPTAYAAHSSALPRIALLAVAAAEALYALALQLKSA